MTSTLTHHPSSPPSWALGQCVTSLYCCHVWLEKEGFSQKVISPTLCEACDQQLSRWEDWQRPGPQMPVKCLGGSGRRQDRLGWEGGSLQSTVEREPNRDRTPEPSGRGTTALILMVMVPRHSTDSSSAAWSQGRGMQSPGRSGEGLYAPQHYTGSPSFT